ncbi:hypothetical protein ABPG74_018652 [Tetrahymena malaccensis]
MRYFFFLVWLIQFVQSKQCATGCQTCQDSGNSINQCIQCSNSYQLVDQSQQCEYQQCSVNQYFQIEDASKSDEIGKCVSICNPLYQENTFTNLCDQLQQCSSLFQTKQNGANQVKLNDLFVFQNQFYVALFENSLSIYDKTNLYLIETFTYDAGDVSVVNLGGSVFVITNTSAIYYWDIIQEQRLFLFKYQNQELKANYTISQYIDFTQASEISNRISSVSSQTNQNTEMTNIKQIQKKTSIFYESRSLSRKKTLNQQKPNFDLTDNKNFSTISNSSKQENDQLTIVTTEGAETPILKKKFSFLNNPKASLFLKRQDSDKTSPKADVSKIATLQYSQQLTEENDPKKVQRYSFTPKLFQLSSSKKSQNTFTFTTQDQEK